MTNDESSKAWYKQFWPWFLIALPASAVVASMTTIVIASRNIDGMVVDNYYKEGLAINRKLDQVNTAKKMKLRAQVEINDSLLKVSFTKEADSFNDTVLVMRFIHPTRAELDFELMPTKTAQNTFNTNLPATIKGAWHVHLSPVSVESGTENVSSWRLTGKWAGNRNELFELSAK